MNHKHLSSMQTPSPTPRRWHISAAALLTLSLVVSSFAPLTNTLLTSVPTAQAATLAETLPVVPTINESTKTNLRSILSNGQTQGNRAAVFAKIGDSITATGSFLVDMGCPSDPPNNYAGFATIVEYFKNTSLGASSTWCGTGNSFTRDSRAAASGWRTNEILGIATGDAGLRAGCNASESQLACELRQTKPGFALVMIGTNDVDGIASGDVSINAYKTRLETIVTQIQQAGTIPVLSTIPPRLDQGGALQDEVAQVNQAIIEVAQARNIPTWNYWRALQNIGSGNRFGMDPDGIHPTTYQNGNASILEGTALNNGYNVRNLTALQVLAKLKSVVIDNGSTDSGTTPTTTPTPTPVPVVPPTTPTTPTPTTPPPVATPSTPGSPRTIRVYVAGESIERRNRHTEAPFTSNGSLNNPQNNDDDQYGWMVPLAERLKLRDPNLTIQFVGAQPWANAEDNPYSGTYPSTTPGRTSAISGSSVEDWTNARRSELVNKTYCYDAAFASRGGNDTSVDDTSYKTQLKSLIRLLAQGSNCQANPVIFVTAHMPDSQGSISSLRPLFVDRVRAAVNELQASESIRVRFIDMFTPFATNQATTAFPNPSWTTGSNAFDINKIGREGDGLHPRRFASIYAGEIAANAINMGDLGGSSSPTPTPTPTPVVAPTPTPIIAPTTPTTPSFTLGVSPTALTLVQGASGAVTLNLQRTGNFRNSIRFAYDRVPTNTRASFNLSRTTGNSARFTVTVGRTTRVGSYVINVRAISGSITRTFALPITVIARNAPAPDLTLTRNPGSLSIQQGQNGSVNVSVARLNGLTGNITVTASGLPTGVSASTLTLQNGTTAGTITFSTNQTATVGGPTTVTLRATSGAVSKTVTLPLTITRAPVVTPTPAPATPLPTPTIPQPSSANRYDIGTPTVRDIWVSPSGNDNNSGATRGTALRSLDAAWRLIPSGNLSGTGYRIMMTTGTYPESSLPNYMELKRGTAQFPIMIQAADGRGTVTLGGDLNVANVSYLYLVDINLIPSPAGDAFHCESCDHLLMRGMRLSGGNRAAHETIKINQSQHVYIEDSDISGAEDNTIDFVAVQYGHLINNKISNAEDWCVYAKGGSAYLRYEGNEIFNCGTGGFTAGQGTGFEYMVNPWLHYEAYGITFVNNIIHDTDGAALGVNGGYNIVMANNTAYRVGQRDHMIEFNHGRRGCDGDTSQNVAGNCSRHQTNGGWGNTGGEEQYIPNKHIYVYNNIFYNPSGYASPSFIQVPQGLARPPANTNLPPTTRADEDLNLKNNVFWNGTNTDSIGIEDTAHCQNDNATCNITQLRRDNRFNTLQPELINPAGGDFRPTSNSNIKTLNTIALPTLSWSDLPARPIAPGGYTSLSLPLNREGVSRLTTNYLGAY